MGILRGLLWIAEKIRDQAEAELHDDVPVRQALLDLYRDLETGRIAEAEFDRQEAELVSRLAAIEEGRRGAQEDLGDEGEGDPQEGQADEGDHAPGEGEDV
jgi:hypothetical protein